MKRSSEIMSILREMENIKAEYYLAVTIDPDMKVQLIGWGKGAEPDKPIGINLSKNRGKIFLRTSINSLASRYNELAKSIGALDRLVHLKGDVVEEAIDQTPEEAQPEVVAAN